MSSPQIRRADRVMLDERALETLVRGYSGRLATVSADGSPYCIPLLYLWMNGEVYVHTTNARGHLRANIERDQRVCFELMSRKASLTTAGLNAIQVSPIAACVCSAGCG